MRRPENILSPTWKRGNVDTSTERVDLGVGEKRLLGEVLEEESEGGKRGTGEEVERGELEGGIDRLSREHREPADEEAGLRGGAQRQQAGLSGGGTDTGSGEPEPQCPGALSAGSGSLIFRKRIRTGRCGTSASNPYREVPRRPRLQRPGKPVPARSPCGWCRKVL